MEFDEVDNPYEGETRTGKEWYAAFCATSRQMAEAISVGDWPSAVGWAQLASWQHEKLS